MTDAKKKGRHHPHYAKLAPGDRQAILYALAHGIPEREIALIFEVSRQAIDYVISQATGQHEHGMNPDHAAQHLAVVVEKRLAGLREQFQTICQL